MRCPACRATGVYDGCVCEMCRGSQVVASYKACAMCEAVQKIEYTGPGWPMMVNASCPDRNGRVRVFCDKCDDILRAHHRA